MIVDAWGIIEMAESEIAPRRFRARPPSAVGRARCWAVALALLTMAAAGCDNSAPDRALAAPPVTLAHDTEVAAVGVQPTSESAASLASATVPDWAADAIFYQIFPERFANGDRSNDPTRESLEFADSVPQSWTVSTWTADWYARADWEREIGPSFFENGVFHRRYGGDLQGVIDKLDYLATLGINTIYFNPVFYARSLHKYDGNSFHHIDPHFGPDPAGDLALMADESSDPATWHWTAADKLFLDLLRLAHARNIRIIVDGVFNHTGRDFFAFADLRRRQRQSPYRDWYLVQGYDDPATPQNEFRYRGWWGVDTLPEFANNDDASDLHPGPKQYIFDSTTRWMDPNADGDSSDGIDGWRLDVANEVPAGFWRDWHAHARRVNPQCYTVAEVWEDAARFLASGGFTATMNYHGFSFLVKGYLIDEVLPPSGAAREFDLRRSGYPRAAQYALQNLMDSHDTDRLASMIVNAGRRPYSKPERFDFDIDVSPRYVPDYDVRKPNDHERRVQRLVALLQMTYVGPPMVYYGTEAGMWGADDPCDRMPMVWPDATYEPQKAHPLGRERKPDLVAFDKGLCNFYRAAIAMRRECPALRRGDIEFIAADDAEGFLAFRRTLADETLLVGLNRGDAPYQWKIPLGNGIVSQVFTASGDVDQFRIDNLPGRAVVTVPAIDGVVLRVSPKE